MAKVIPYLSGISNIFFLIGNDGAVIVVDSGSEVGDEIFPNACKEVGVDPNDIKLIIISHGHVDHFINLPAMREATGAPILCHREAAPYLREGKLPDVVPLTPLGKAIWDRQKITGPPCGEAPAVEPDYVIGDEDYDLSCWGIDGKIIYSPGHSRHDLSIVSKDENEQIVALIGDLFADPPEEEFHGNGDIAFFTYPGGTVKQTIESIKRLLDMGVQFFYSGHGGPFERRIVEERIDKYLY